MDSETEEVLEEVELEVEDYDGQIQRAQETEERGKYQFEEIKLEDDKKFTVKIFRDGYSEQEITLSADSDLITLENPIELSPEEEGEEEEVFVAYWDTENTDNDTPDDTIVLPLVEEGEYDFVVDWGDGQKDYITEYDEDKMVHKYDNPGRYPVKIEGKVEGWNFRTGEKEVLIEGIEKEKWGEKLDQVTNWGDNFVFGKTGDVYNIFVYSENLTTITADDGVKLSETSLEIGFADCRNLEYVKNIEDWDVGGIENMRLLFYGAEKFNQDLGDWDVGDVVNMRTMFYGAESFNKDLGDWDVDNVENMKWMFGGAESFDQDIGDWDVDNVVNMEWMFYGAESFDQNIGNWDVGNVEDTNQMFGGAKSFDQDIGDWDVENVEDMSAMFSGAELFDQDIGDWNVKNVKDMEWMFGGAKSFDQDIGDWDVDNIENMGSMFNEAESFNQDIGDWDVGNVEDMNHMFDGAESFDQDIGDWDVGYVKDMSAMFQRAELFDQDIGNWDVENVESMRYMFSRAKSFNQDIGDWNVGNVEVMKSMFYDSDFSTENYDNFLVGLKETDEEHGLVEGVELGVKDVEYTADSEAEAARDYLIEEKEWSIEGDVKVD